MGGDLPPLKHKLGGILGHPVEELQDTCDFEHLKDNFRLPQIEINFYGHNFPALVDSGSQVSCISEEVWVQFSGVHDQIPSFLCSGVKLTGAFKAKQKKVERQCLLTFQAGDAEFEHEFLVAPDLAYPVIIGVDFLRTIGAIIDLENEKIRGYCGDRKIVIEEKSFGHEFESGIPVKNEIKLISSERDFLVAHVDVSEHLDFRDAIASCEVLSNEQRFAFEKLLINNKEIFSNILGLTNIYTHHIKLSDESEFFVKPYPLPLAHREAVDKTLQDLEKWGVIERVATPYVSPLMTIVKKDNSVRICLDARFLNKRMQKEYEMPPPIEEILLSMSGCKFMSTLDFTMGYYQIPLTPESRKYTGFMVGKKTFQFRVLPFGLATSVSAFVRCMDAVFGSEFKGFLRVYVDDVIIISDSFQDHLWHLERVFCRLKECGLTLKLKKCSFFRTEIKFLGYILSPTGVKPSPDRVQGIKEYRVPRNIKELQKFLGMCNFDRPFCPNFAAICEPLTKLLRKKQRWQWTDNEQNAFEKIKQLLIDATLLYHPNPKLEWNVVVDASDLALGAQLFQLDNGERKVVAWASRILLPRETRYSASEKEILGAVWALERFRTYLLGNKFTLYTDNRALTYLNKCRLLSPRITRWALTLQEFTFDIRYIPGKENCVADALSRFSGIDRPPTPMERCFKVLSNFKTNPQFSKFLLKIETYQREDE